MSKRRKYSQEFKQEAVQMANTSGHSISQVAGELGVNSTMLGRWCREHESGGHRAFPGQGVSRDEEVTALKRELSRVRKERDFLKEAAAFFAKESK
jgi:transposase